MKDWNTVTSAHGGRGQRHKIQVAVRLRQVGTREDLEETQWCAKRATLPTHFLRRDRIDGGAGAETKTNNESGNRG